MNSHSRHTGLSGLARLAPPGIAGGAQQPTWVKRLRNDAAARAAQLGVPSSHDEEWRYTDLAPLLSHVFTPSHATPVTLDDIAAFIIPEAAASRLVLVNGVFNPALSAWSNTPGVRMLRLNEEWVNCEMAVHAQLARHASFQTDVFAALNTQTFEDGVLLMIGKDQCCPAPIHLLHVTTRHDTPTAAAPRCLALTEPGSECTLIEDYVNLGDSVYFNNAITEIAVAENAQVTHIKLQREASSAFHIAGSGASIARNGRYYSTTISLGARLSRHTLNATLAGDGAECVLNGLTLIDGQQLADTHSTLLHSQPHGSSRQLHKCIVDGAAHAVFNGKIVVSRGAQLTDAAQSSRNLLLSSKAKVDTKPQLEILADDVKCAHGATVGQLDKEELFYLRSRGLDERAARSLLTYAFAAEVIARITVASVAERLRRELFSRTQQSL